MMHEEERNLDQHILNMRKSMQLLLEDSAHKGNLYIAEDDIKDIPCFANETLVAVRAPHGTTLEVPDPNEGNTDSDEKRYQIFLKSASGPVEVFLVSLNDDLEERPMEGGDRGGEGVQSGVNELPSKKEIKSEWDEPADAGAKTETQNGQNQNQTPGPMRILPSSCDPDYWFSDEATEFGLNDMFVAGEMGGDDLELGNF